MVKNKCQNIITIIFQSSIIISWNPLNQCYNQHVACVWRPQFGDVCQWHTVAGGRGHVPLRNRRRQSWGDAGDDARDTSRQLVAGVTLKRTLRVKVKRRRATVWRVTVLLDGERRTRNICGEGIDYNWL